MLLPEMAKDTRKSPFNLYNTRKKNDKKTTSRENILTTRKLVGIELLKNELLAWDG